MKDDPRVAPPPPSRDFQDVLDDYIKAFDIESRAPSERERARYEEFIERRRQKEIERLTQQQAHFEAVLEAQNKAAKSNALMDAMAARQSQQQAVSNADQLPVNGLGQWGSGMMNSSSFVGKKPMFPNVGTPAHNNRGPLGLEESGDAARQAQDYGLMNMNQIARAKYQGLFELLDIKLRYTGTAWGECKQWVIAKAAKDGRMTRQEWTAPSQDPGCSLRTWDAMMAELLDEVARRDGVEIKHAEYTAGVESAGQQVSSGAGNS